MCKIPTLFINISQRNIFISKFKITITSNIVQINKQYIAKNICTKGESDTIEFSSCNNNSINGHFGLTHSNYQLRILVMI